MDFNDFDDYGAMEAPAAAGAGDDDDDDEYYAFSAEAGSAEVQYPDGSPYDPYGDDDMDFDFRQEVRLDPPPPPSGTAATSAPPPGGGVGLETGSTGSRRSRGSRGRGSRGSGSNNGKAGGKGTASDEKKWRGGAVLPAPPFSGDISADPHCLRHYKKRLRRWVKLTKEFLPPGAQA